MTRFILTTDASDVIVRWRYIEDEEYTLDADEVEVPPDAFDDEQLSPPGSMSMESADPVEIGPNFEYEGPDILDRNALDPGLLQTYRDARDTYLAERQNFIDAKDADDVQGQLDALASLAENATVPALDALFRAAMGEEP